MSSNQPIDIFFAVLINIANVIGILYNIPQMVHTYRRKTADDISALFLNLRTLCSVIWIIYSVYYQLWYVLISFASSLVSSVFISYYRFEWIRKFIQRRDSDSVKTEKEKEVKTYAEMVDIVIDPREGTVDNGDDARE